VALKRAFGPICTDSCHTSASSPFSMTRFRGLVRPSRGAGSGRGACNSASRRQCRVAFPSVPLSDRWCSAFAPAPFQPG
jgi:hypothetical protein